ncbi:hypothetical protein [Cupriavidus sp. IDO]|jgi:hypothetical protein|uniref:hypothetical protein n=1 Tax=Cupriavidus sp. IDO TaxID=1539142 RepID=UPI0005793F12|nr:hypothetical protein [Cupriavidus sp. IDO]KWR90557.1 hypothetical protein RM96_08970 [Cupriavidus sp. IDO]
MRARFARGLTQSPVTVIARPFDGDGMQAPQVGDLVTVYSQDQDTEFNIRLCEALEPGRWRGVVYAIGRGQDVLVTAEGLEIDDVVEVMREEIASVIPCGHSH